MLPITCEAFWCLGFGDVSTQTLLSLPGKLVVHAQNVVVADALDNAGEVAAAIACLGWLG